MTNRDRRAALVVLLGVAGGLTGCGTPKEKTAPCKRPANVLSYAADASSDCGPMRPLNSDPGAAAEAIRTVAPD